MHPLPIYQVIFYFFSFVLVASTFMVVISQGPVKSVLFLILAFVASSVIWIMIQAEFLALVLVFVYVGAVMTLFLFIVMMLNIKSIKSEGFVRYMPFAVIVFILFIGLIVGAFMRSKIGIGAEIPHYPVSYSNTQELGVLLYSQYFYPLEIAGAILLAAIVSAIALAFSGRKFGTKTQNISDQHMASKESSIRIVKMKSEKP